MVSTRPPYRAVLLDPPWPERGGGKVKRGADRHYVLAANGLRAIYQIIELSPEWRYVAEDAYGFMWGTNTFLPQALELLRQLGFRYVTKRTWVKLQEITVAAALRRLMRQGASDAPELLETVTVRQLARVALQTGLGQYGRGSDEYVLIGVRGRPPMPDTKARAPSVLFAERTATHSEKPGEVHAWIEGLTPGPYLELFARKERAGWTCWGLEV